MNDHADILSDALLACESITSLEVDLADHPALAAPIAVGILTEEVTTESSPAEPLAFFSEDSARATARLLQAVHDLAGQAGRIDEGDAVTFEVLEYFHWPYGEDYPRWDYYIVPILRHSTESIETATPRDALTRPDILAAACGVRL